MWKGADSAPIMKRAMSLLRRFRLPSRPVRRSPSTDRGTSAWKELPDGSRQLQARCTVCGSRGKFTVPPGATPREALFCPSCRSTSRYRAIARGFLQAIVELRGVGAPDLASLAKVTGAPRLRIYDTQVAFNSLTAAYPHPDLLAAVPWIDVMTSSFRPELPWGSRLGDHTTNQNLEALTFSDAEFDIVVTSDVMEHVRLHERAHAEIRRVLRPGGIYLFTVPYLRWQAPDAERIVVADPADEASDRQVLPAEYHGDPNGSNGQSLVYRVYGTDLDRRLRRLGFSVAFSLEDRLDEAIVDAELFVCRLGQATDVTPASRSGAPLRLAPAREPLAGQELERTERPRPAFPDGHFHSPVVDLAEVERDRARIWPARSEVLGIDFREDHHRALLEGPICELLADYDYPSEAKPGLREIDYHEGNTEFGWLDSKLLFALLRYLRPRRMIEVGSGYSSLLAADVNRRFLGGAMELTCIEPYPRSFLRRGVPGVSRLLEQRIQEVPLAELTSLADGDLLFIDSSHVAKTGSDVNHLVFEILPRLAPGVFVHFHDIFLPHDYPPHWVLDGRRSWNEQYLVRALLMDSAAFEVFFSCYYAFCRFPELEARATRRPATGGASLWVRRRK